MHVPGGHYWEGGFDTPRSCEFRLPSSTPDPSPVFSRLAVAPAAHTVPAGMSLNELLRSHINVLRTSPELLRDCKHASTTASLCEELAGLIRGLQHPSDYPVAKQIITSLDELLSSDDDYTFEPRHAHHR